MIVLPPGPRRVVVRFVANQPPGEPCWRAVVEDGPSLVVHRVRFDAPARTELSGERGHVEGTGALSWDGLPGLGLVVG